MTTGWPNGTDTVCERAGWRNGSASDSSPEGWEFESPLGHCFFGGTKFFLQTPDESRVQVNTTYYPTVLSHESWLDVSKEHGAPTQTWCARLYPAPGCIVVNAKSRERQLLRATDPTMLSCTRIVLFGRANAATGL